MIDLLLAFWDVFWKVFLALMFFSLIKYIKNKKDSKDKKQ